MAITIHLATNIITIQLTDENGDPVDVLVPDIGSPLRELMRETTPGTFVGANYSPDLYGAITLVDVNNIRITGTDYRCLSGQVGSQDLFDRIRDTLGPDRVKTGKEAETGVFRGALQSSVRSVNRKSNGQRVGFAAGTAIAGFDPVLSTLDETDDPEDFEGVDPT